MKTATLVRGSVDLITRTRSQRLQPNHKRCQTRTALYMLNIFLAFSLAVSVAALVLAHATRYVNTSLKVTLIATVTAIVTNWLLSIGKRIFGGSRDRDIMAAQNMRRKI